MLEDLHVRTAADSRVLQTATLALGRLACGWFLVVVFLSLIIMKVHEWNGVWKIAVWSF
jgi:succinate dehydrogenase hydrophobic anchor subunit